MSLSTAGYQIRLAPRSDLWVSALIIQGSNSKQLQEGPDLSIDQHCLLYIQFKGHLLDHAAAHAAAHLLDHAAAHAAATNAAAAHTQCPRLL